MIWFDLIWFDWCCYLFDHHSSFFFCFVFVLEEFSLSSRTEMLFFVIIKRYGAPVENYTYIRVRKPAVSRYTLHQSRRREGRVWIYSKKYDKRIPDISEIQITKHKINNIIIIIVLDHNNISIIIIHYMIVHQKIRLLFTWKTTWVTRKKERISQIWFTDMMHFFMTHVQVVHNTITKYLNMKRKE